MRYQEFDNIADLVAALEKAEDEYKWTHDPKLFKQIILTGVMCGKFELITAKGEWIATETIVVCTESNKPFFEHESFNTWFVLKDSAT